MRVIISDRFTLRIFEQFSQNVAYVVVVAAGHKPLERLIFIAENTHGLPKGARIFASLLIIELRKSLLLFLLHTEPH